MKPLCTLSLLLLAAPLAAAGSTLQEARQALLRGNYAEAREIYEDHLKNPKTRAAAAIGISKSYEAQGEYDKALSAVELRNYGYAISLIGAVLKESPGFLDGRKMLRKAEIAVDQAALAIGPAVDQPIGLRAKRSARDRPSLASIPAGNSTH